MQVTLGRQARGTRDHSRQARARRQALAHAGACVAVVALGFAAPAWAGPAEAWQPLGGASDGTIGLAPSDDAAAVVHDGQRYVAMIEEDRQLVVYRQFRPSYGTTQSWQRDGGLLNRRADATASRATLLSSGGVLYAAWIETRDRPFIMVSRMRRDARARVRWEPVGEPIATRRELPATPALVALDGTLRLLFQDAERRPRVAKLANGAWQLAPTPIGPPGSLRDAVVYHDAIYVLNQISYDYTVGGTNTVTRVLPTAGGDIRVQNLGEVAPFELHVAERLGLAPPTLGDGRPIVAFIDRDAIEIRQLSAEGNAFVTLTRIAAPTGERFWDRPLLAALGDELLVGARNQALHIYRLAPSLQLLGQADPPRTVSLRAQLIADVDANAALLTFRRSDVERVAALALRL